MRSSSYGSTSKDSEIGHGFIAKEPVKVENDDFIPVRSPRWSGIALSLSISLGFLVFLSIYLKASAGFITDPSVLTSANELKFSVSNEYGQSVKGYKWDHIVEPYRLTTLTAILNDDDQEGTYIWVVGDTVSSTKVAYYTFQDVGFNLVNVSWTSLDGETKLSASSQVACKYVRREMRAMTVSDRERFLDTLRLLYDLKTKDGQASYGEKYKDIHYFVKKHLHGAAALDCDHWHDNAGIMTHHLAFTLELEQTLQAVDPAISVPYWEYTKDSILHADGDWESSEVFLDEWFGVASPTSNDHVVTEGRWAYAPIMSDASDYSNITNSYGLLRSPWNTNPTAYFTRYDKVLGNEFYKNFPTCTQFSECIKRPSIAQINECLNGETHGPVHIMIGGQWGSVSSAVAMKEYGLAPQHLLLAKNLWRHGYVKCPDSCDDSSSECKCSCPASQLDTTPYKILTEKTGLLHWIDDSSRAIYFDEDDGEYHIQGFTAEMEAGAWQDILDALCDPGHAGEMYTSAAPYDPTFWVLHTAAERLLQYRRMQADVSPLDETWGFAHMNAASDVGVVCDWSSVENGGDSLPTCTAKLCEGHGATDTLPFSDFLGHGETYSNMQFYDFMEPNNDQILYVYDNFEWEHCESQGVSMDVSVSSSQSIPPPAAV